MSYHGDLLDVARGLASAQGQERPRQASLRRTVSTAYYALFHFLIDEAMRSVVGADHSMLDVRRTIGRAMNHGEMNEVCKGFANGTPKNIDHLFTNVRIILPEVTAIADAFVKLQDARHKADYDLSFRFQRSQVVVLIETAATSLADFRRASASDDKKIFLTALVAAKRVRR